MFIRSGIAQLELLLLLDTVRKYTFQGIAVDSSKLRPWQARKIAAVLQPAVGNLTRLQRRMELTGFPPNDPLYIATVTARRAAQTLLVDLHYQQFGFGQTRGWRQEVIGIPDCYCFGFERREDYLNLRTERTGNR